MLRFLWLRTWSLRAVVWVAVVGVTISATLFMWREDPIERWNPEAAAWIAIVAGFFGASLPVRWIVDKIWGRIEEREDRLAGEP